MVKLTKIYTRTGDEGDTGLVGGARVAKSHPRIEAVGAVDEANSAIGVARASFGGSLSEAHGPLDQTLERIQNDLFDLGADLSTPERDEDLDYEPLRMTPAQTEWLERKIDTLNASLEPLTSFILPAGSRAGADLHLARALARRAERAVARLAEAPDEPVSAPVKTYINRLSDFLFVAARAANAASSGEVLWRPGANRG